MRKETRLELTIQQGIMICKLESTKKVTKDRKPVQLFLPCKTPKLESLIWKASTHVDHLAIEAEQGRCHSNYENGTIYS